MAGVPFGLYWEEQVRTEPYMGRRIGTPIICRGLACMLILLVIGIAFPLEACVPRQSTERESLRNSDLVELIRLDPTLKLDMRYASSNNFLGRPVYPEARAFLQRPAAEALVRAHQGLEGQGYGLLVFDAYRPWSVSKLFWDKTPAEKKRFVANPKAGSRHNRGCAVDLTLFDLRSGQEVAMPSAFDEFSERAYRDYEGGTEEARHLRGLLRIAMESEGFRVNEFEWWHFDYEDWRDYPILDLSFCEIGEADP